jgi:hypothetical protein
LLKCLPAVTSVCSAMNLVYFSIPRIALIESGMQTINDVNIKTERKEDLEVVIKYEIITGIMIAGG